MEVFRHHLYEYQKGLRNLVLHTAPESLLPRIEGLLQAHNVAYRIVHLHNGHANVFFGSSDCLAVLEAIAKDNLSEFTEEEDFILGTMLGYGRLEQCRRYVQRKRRRIPAAV